MPKTAVFVRRFNDWGEFQDARLYRVSEPFRSMNGKWYSYVIVSAMDHELIGPETLVYPANSDGTMGSSDPIEYISGLDHKLALQKAGYEIES